MFNFSHDEARLKAIALVAIAVVILVGTVAVNVKDIVTAGHQQPCECTRKQ